MSQKVCRVTSLTKSAFFALSQQYEAEFGKITGKLPDANGNYKYTEVASGKYEGWIFFQATQIAGFAVIDISRARTDVAEFYIVPALRRQNLGRIFASILFDQYPGPWQVRQIRGAEYARDFWERAIASYSQNNFESAIETDTEWGMVYIQRFESIAPAR